MMVYDDDGGTGSSRIKEEQQQTVTSLVQAEAVSAAVTCRCNDFLGEFYWPPATDSRSNGPSKPCGHSLAIGFSFLTSIIKINPDMLMRSSYWETLSERLVLMCKSVPNC